MEKLANFYKNKRVFITGHTGFKGKWLTAVLLKFKAKITGFSLNDEKKKDYEYFLDYKKVKNIYGDVSNYNKLKNEIKAAQPDLIFHLAAQPLVSDSYFKPLNTFKTNFLGSINIFEITRKLKIKSVVVITSDKCYFNKEILRGYKENDQLGGKDPYSSSKASVEIAFEAYLQSFFNKEKKIGVATARAGNVIGGGDWSKNRIIPDCVKTIIKKRTMIIRSPKSTRPWQHVLEPISGYLVLAKKLHNYPKKFSGSWNFGPRLNETKKVIEVAKIIINKIYSKKKIKVIFKKGKFREAKLLKLNSNKAAKYLDWSTKWSMLKGLNKTAEWYDCYVRKNNTKLMTKNQIENYFND